MAINRLSVAKNRQKFLEKNGLPRYRAKKLLVNLTRTEQGMAMMSDIADFFCGELEGMDDEAAWRSHELAAFEAAYKKFHNLEEGRGQIVDQMRTYGLKIRV